MKHLLLVGLMSLAPLTYAKTVSSVAIAPQGAVVQSASTLQFSATCTYSDNSTDNCSAAGGATWTTSRTSALTVNNAGLATWVTDPGSGSLQSGYVIVSAGAVTDKAALYAQHPGDTWYEYITPDYRNYADGITGAPLPMNVAVGATVALGEGVVINAPDLGHTGIPAQPTCNWSSSNPAIATVDRIGHVTAASPGSVTITCGRAGNGVFGNSSGSGWVAPGNIITLNIVNGGTGTTTWYVRPKGGTPYTNSTDTPNGQCDGKHDADYPGTGVNQPCALGGIRYLWSTEVGYDNLHWMISGGDTVIVRQSSTGYNVGLDKPSSSGWFPSNCNGNQFGCHMPSIPSGTATKHTRILGENYASCHSDSAKTKLWVSYGAYTGIDVTDSQFVDVACFEISDQAACTSNGSYTNVCGTNADAGSNGVVQSALTASVNYSDLFIHGIVRDGISGAPGVGVVADYVHIRAAPDAGINMDDSPWQTSNISVAGGFTLTNSITEFTGCVEEYPIVHNYPYIECRDQNVGAYGDGFGTASTSGDWLFDHDIWRYNFQDGLDLLHSGMHNLVVTNSQSYGNDGQAYKIGSGDSIVFRNNIAEVNCNRIAATFGDEPASAIVPGVAVCRAAGDGLLFNFTDQGTYLVQDNTFVGYNSTMFDLECEGGWDFCPNAATTFENNVVLGYQTTLSGDGRFPGLFYNENASMPANGGWAVRDHNLFYNVRYCPSPLLAGEVCNTADPQFAVEPPSPVTSEAVMDSFNFTPSSSSPLIGAGISIASIATDIAGVLRQSPPTIGAIEVTSGNAPPALKAPTVTLTVSSSTQLVGQTGTFSASVAPLNGVTPTGSISFYNAVTSLGTVALNSSASATLSTASLGSGSYVVTAVYSGDTTYSSAASSAISLNITAPGNNGPPALQTASLVLSASPNPATAGQTVTLTCSATGTANAAPTGTVTFSIAGTSIGTSQLDRFGVATVSTSSLGTGTYAVTASYSGDSTYAPGTSSAISLSVTAPGNLGPPTLLGATQTVSASPNPVTAGQLVTLSSAVNGSGNATPTGTVTFTIGGAAVGNSQLNGSGIATTTVNSLSAGTYAVTSTYSGDGTYAASGPTTISLTVKAAPQANAVSLSVGQPTYGFNVIPGSTRRIFATVTNGSANQVTWSVKSGSGHISSNSGSWIDVTAPASGSSCKITTTTSQYSVSSSTQFVIEATSVDDPSKKADVTFNVCNPAVEVSVVPFYRAVYANQPVDLQSLILGTTDPSVHWAISSQPKGGDGSLTDTTSRDTVFTATVAGRYHITATSQADQKVTATAIVYVTGHSLPYRVTPNLTEPVDCSADPSSLGTTYDVGPSQSFKTLAGVSFPTMVAGSTVRLHNEDMTGLHPTEFHEYVQISQAGTADQPIRLCGVPDAAGNLPIIDGTNATGRSDDTANVAGLGLVTLHDPSNQANWPNYSAAAFVVVEGIQMRNAKKGSSFVTPGGSQGVWSENSAAIRINQAQNTVFVGNDINNNSTGVVSAFNASGSWGSSDINVLWEGNHIHNNGLAGSATSHQMDLQAWGEVVQFNRIDEYPSGGLGSNIKSRGIQDVIRYNYLGDGPARQMDLVDVQNATAMMSFEGFLSGGASSVYATNPQDTYPADRIAAEQEASNSDFVYGNIYQNSISAVPIHFGEELSGGEAARKGSLYWYNNTFYQKTCNSCSTQNWTLFDTSAGNGQYLPQTEFQTIQAFNNIIWMDNPSSPVFQFNNYDAFIGVAGKNLLPSKWGSNNTAGGSGTGWVASVNSMAYQNAENLGSHLTGFTSANLITATSMPFDANTWTLNSGVSGQQSVPTAVCQMPVRFAYLPSLGYVVPRTDAPNVGATDTAAQTAIQMNAVSGNGRYHTRYSACR